jgi:DNA primase
VPRHSETIKSAIKNAVDIVALVGESRALRRSGSRYKALCPFHDDHNPSLELNPERQSYKCWSCGAGGDVFDFVMHMEHVDFPEALRMLADRAGVALGSPPTRSESAVADAPSKSDMLEITAWAEALFVEALGVSPIAKNYVRGRGLTEESVERFRLGYAPEERGWILAHARRNRISLESLEHVGLVAQAADAPGIWRERFRGRLIFPIHDERGRTLGFGGRILPEVERVLADQGTQVAKYINSPETTLFHKRTLLFGADLAKQATREAGSVAVVEGYTDVIAAHQVGLRNVVGTLGTALGEDHLRSIRRLSESVVLVFDGDQAGQNAADRSLEFFLGSELDLRVLTLPANLDPCDFLLNEGATAFRSLIDGAVDPLTYLVSRAEERFDLDSIEGSRRAAEWILGTLAHVPDAHRHGLEFKKAKVLDALSHRLRVPLETLRALLRQVRRPPTSQLAGGVLRVTAATPPSPTTDGAVAPPAPVRQGDLDPTDLELIRIALNEPGVVRGLIHRIAVSTLQDAALRVILQSCYDLQSEGREPSYENVMLRIDEPAVRRLATDLVSQHALSTADPAPLPERARTAPWPERLERLLVVLDERERRIRLRDLEKTLQETDPSADRDAYDAIVLEYRRLLTSGRSRRN